MTLSRHKNIYHEIPDDARSSYFSINSIAQEILPADIQIKTALLAAPSDMKDSATVLGYDKDGKVVTLRQGNGKMICLADDPNKKE